MNISDTLRSLREVKQWGSWNYRGDLTNLCGDAADKLEALQRFAQTVADDAPEHIARLARNVLEGIE